MNEKECNVWIGGICTALLMLAVLFIAFFPSHCAHAATIYLKYGECRIVKYQKVCAPAKNICPVCPTCSICPTPKPCPTQSPCNCPAQVPCPSVDENSVYWYAISSLMLACSSTDTWGLPSESYIAKFVGLDVGNPVSQTTQSGCYVREWTKAMVIVNPMDTLTCVILLNGQYKDLDTGLIVSTSVSVGPKQGMVLTK